MIELDKEVLDAVKGLTLEFKDEPQPELLIKMLNRNKDVDFLVEIVTSEFTSLCPLNIAQPDYATIVVSYVPDHWLVELKSLKYYFVSFRSAAVFHEDVPTTILKSLTGLLKPRTMEVSGQFTIRGGITTTVRAFYSSQAEKG